MKITTVAVDKIYPIISDSLQKNRLSYKKNIEQFIRDRSNDLYDTVPISRMPFTWNDIENFFKSVKINKNDITECLKDTYYWNMNFNPRAAKDEMTMSMMMIIRYFLLQAKEGKKDAEKDVEISTIYLAFSGKFYPSIHSQKFKFPLDNYRYVMEYILNNILTNKYDLKREGSVLGAVRSICRTWINTYSDKFMNPNDEDVADMIQQLHGRIKSFLGNIATVFYDTLDNKSIGLTYSSDSGDEDSYRIADNDSLLAERCVENAMTWITTKGADYRLCKMASDSNVKVDEIRSIIESIQGEPANIPIIREFCQLMIIEFFMNSKERDVTSYAFLRWAVVAKPNTKNKNIIRQKQIVEDWLNENSPAYRKRKSRLATKNSYHKSVTVYYALVINESNK